MTSPDCTTPTKRCSKCKTFKPTDQFAKNAGERDGFQKWCKACRAEYYAANRERERAKQGAYYREHKELYAKRQQVYLAKYKDSIRERRKKRYWANREERIIACRLWRAANLEYARARERAYNVSEHGRRIRRIGEHRRRTLLVSAPGAFTENDLIAIRAAQTDKRGQLHCWWCGKPIKGTPHVDHKIALAAGGTHDPGNLCYTCKPCNLSKNVKSPAEFAGRLL